MPETYESVSPPPGWRWADGEWEVETFRDTPDARWIADGSPEGVSLILPIELIDDHTFTVTVKGCENRQALQVMSERLNHDEDFGFPYSIEWEIAE